jgi:glycerol-1-phosphate dehydrogenase [NAD(P)+]
MRRAIRAVHRSPAELESALRRVQGPVRSTELGVSDNDYLAAVLHAREIRDRFTFLDLAAETGGIAAAGLC